MKGTPLLRSSLNLQGEWPQDHRGGHWWRPPTAGGGTEEKSSIPGEAETLVKATPETQVHYTIQKTENQNIREHLPLPHPTNKSLVIVTVDCS